MGAFLIGRLPTSAGAVQVPVPDPNAEAVRWLGAEQSLPLEFFWREGLQMESADKVIQVRLGAGMQYDNLFLMSQDEKLKSAVGIIRDGSEFRRARFQISGVLQDFYEFKAEYDFSGGETTIQDLYIGFRNLPGFGVLRFGNQKEPLGLDELTSDYSLTFLEQPLPSALAPSRNPGLLAANCFLDKRLTASAGLFREGNSAGDAREREKLHVTLRLTGLPWRQAFDRLLHLGASYYRRAPDDGAVEFNIAPETRLAPFFVSIGPLPTDVVEIVNLESALVFGRFSMHGEYLSTRTESKDLSDFRFAGYYIQSSLFLTQDHRPYLSEQGIFGGVLPSQPFHPSKSGWGAWEAAVRYSFLDLKDKDQAGATVGNEIWNLTAALNWYWTPNLRLQLDFIHGDLKDVGAADMASTRLQLEF